MIRLLLSLALAAVLVTGAAPNQAQTVLIPTPLAEIQEGSLPVAPLVWQGLAYQFRPGTPPVFTGQEPGFTIATDGFIGVQIDGQPEQILAPGQAFGSNMGIRRLVQSKDVFTSGYWFIGLGGPTIQAPHITPQVAFTSEHLIPPGTGPYRLKLDRLIIEAGGVLPPSAPAGTVTMLVQTGAVVARLNDGTGATLTDGAIMTIPATEAVSFRMLRDEPASILLMSLLPVSLPGFQPALPPFLPTPEPSIPQQNVPLLPNGFFPRLPQ